MNKCLFTAFLVALFPLILPAQIYHTEPTNWWVGMNNPDFQLMVHGKDVGLTHPEINYQGVVIKKVNPAFSKNYLFIDIYVSATTKPGPFMIFFIRDGDTVYTQPYTLLARDKNIPIKGFNSSDVIYLLNPDRFANGDYTNDVVVPMKEQKVDRKNPDARHGGDIRGIINHLDYISKMGFTALWPTPLVENDMPLPSYHGYSITNHYKVDPRYGTLEDYKELATKAREKGIKLIYDEVLNHVGTGYWWNNDLPFQDWYNKADSIELTNHYRTVNQDMYASAFDRDLMVHGWFVNHMADMNSENPFVANYLIQNTIWWIETLHLGGIRQDTYGYSDKSFLREWSCRVMNEYPDISMVGEEWSYNPLIVSYWQKGKVNVDGYTSCLTSVMDFPIQSALITSLNSYDTSRWAKNMSLLYEALANDFVYADPQKIMVLGDNHDMDRLYTQLNKDIALTKMAVTYLLTIRGIPQIYYGTEVLMDNTGFHKNDGVIRSDFPGGWKGDLVDGFTTKGLSADQKDMQNYMRQLLTWRKANPVIANGKTMHFAPFNSVYVYFRYNDEKMVMVVMNRNEKDQTIDLSRFKEIMGVKTKIANALTGEVNPGVASLTVKAKTATVFIIE
mgnify:FL=1